MKDDHLYKIPLVVNEIKQSLVSCLILKKKMNQEARWILSQISYSCANLLY